MHVIYSDSNQIDIYNITKTIVHVSISDIIVSGIPCCVCLNAHKSRLILMDD